MPDDRALALFREIQRKTNEGRIAWEPTADERIFFAPVKENYIFESRPFTRVDERSGEGRGFPTIVFKEGARELVVMGYGLTGVGSPELEALYELIKRQALKVDEKIEDVIGEIEKL